MTNGYATDNSDSSNKRVRHADDANAANTRPAATKPAPAKSKVTLRTPISLAEAASEQYVVSLHQELQPSVRKHARVVLRAFATVFRANKTYEMEKNDDAVIPKACNHALTLQPRAIVERDPGFKDLLRETAKIVEECRLRYKLQWMKCSEMNLKSQRDDIARAYAQSLPDIAELLLASEGMLESKNDKHKVVADLLLHKRDDVISFLNMKDDTFVIIYKQLHSLDTFPALTHPPLFGPGRPVTPTQGVTPALNL